MVKVFDGNYSDTQTIKVTVKNAADGSPPVIGSNGGGATAGVSVAENTTAVTVVAATDADNDKLTYSIVGGNDSGLFTIDASTGALKFKSAPDFEAPQDIGDITPNNVYDVIVKVSDGLNSDSQAIAVTVTNVDDGLAPKITSNGAGDTAMVNVAEGKTAVTTVTATDADSPTLLFSISGGADANLFAIDKNTGELTFKSAPDFEYGSPDGDNDYAVIVKVSDGLNSDTQVIQVKVTDVDERHGADVHLLRDGLRGGEHDSGDDGEGDGRGRRDGVVRDRRRCGRGPVCHRRKDRRSDVQGGARFRESDGCGGRTTSTT